MRTITLVNLGLGGVAVATGTGLAINNYIGGESIKEYIEKSKKSKNKVFITTQGLDLGDIKTKYETYNDETKRPKPKNADGTIVDKEQLVEWCSDTVDSKFSNTEDELYKSIISWCFVNSKTLKEEMESDGRQIYSTQNNDGQEWQNAWDSYSKNKDTSTTIKTIESESKLNGEDKTEGGKALEAWCTASKTKKLYEDGMEADYELFKLWCTKA